MPAYAYTAPRRRRRTDRRYTPADNAWKEPEITWENRPARAGGEVGNQDLVRKYSWVEYDVTALVTGDGTYSFVLVGDSEEELRFSSRESSNGPELLITAAPAAPMSASDRCQPGQAQPRRGGSHVYSRGGRERRARLHRMRITAPPPTCRLRATPMPRRSLTSAFR